VHEHGAGDTPAADLPGQHLPIAAGRRRAACADRGLAAGRQGPGRFGRNRWLARGRAAGSPGHRLRARPWRGYRRAARTTVAADDFRTFDWLLCADADNLRDARRLAPPGLAGRAVLLLDWAGTVAGGEVPDPYYGGSDHFEDVWRLVDRAAQAVVARLSGGSGSGIIGP
jgi:hypothetical protein